MPDQTKTFKESCVFGDKLGGVRALLRYELGGGRTRFTIWRSFMFTSLEQLPSKTSSIASIPWEETSCESISGASVRITSWVKEIISRDYRRKENRMVPVGYRLPATENRVQQV